MGNHKCNMAHNPDLFGYAAPAPGCRHKAIAAVISALSRLYRMPVPGRNAHHEPMLTDSVSQDA